MATSFILITPNPLGTASPMSPGFMNRFDVKRTNGAVVLLDEKGHQSKDFHHHPVEDSKTHRPPYTSTIICEFPGLASLWLFGGTIDKFFVSLILSYLSSQCLAGKPTFFFKKKQ